MMRAFRSEWTKSLRPGMLWGGAGTIVGFALLVVTILFLVAKPQADILADAAEQAQAAAEAAVNGTAQQQQPQGALIPFEALEGRDGYAVPFGLSGQLIGVISLVLFAQSVGAEYGLGTLKVLLSHEPRRLRLLSGKLLAMAAFVAAAIAVAFVAQGLLAIALAAARGIDMAAWWSVGGLVDGLASLLRVTVAAVVWGALGALLAMLLRSAPPSIGIGIGYTLVAEPILGLAIGGSSKWLPGNALSAFVAWGSSLGSQQNGFGSTSTLGTTEATVVVILYALTAITASMLVFWRRDVSQ